MTYISQQLIVGQVCRKFYEISCGLKSFLLTIQFLYDDSKNIISYVIDDDEIHKSIVGSTRKIKTIRISGLQFLSGSRSRLREIIESISDNVVEVHIYGMSEFLEDWELLNLMPNTKKLILVGTKFENLVFCQNFKLRLRNLVELKINNSTSNVLEVFDDLPDNVLEKLEVFSISNSSRKFFQNQNCLKEINTNSLDVIDMKNKKLKKAVIKILRFTKDINQIEGQDEITTLELDLDFKHQEVVDLVGRDFKSLEILELSCYEAINLAGLQNLKKLKKLVVSSSTSIASIKSKSLEVLEVDKVTIEFLMNISLNCPSLRELNLSLYPSECVTLSEVLECLPKLEKLRVSATNFNCVSIFKHLNLKHLTLICYGSSEKNFNNLISLVRSCKNLETLSTNVKFENEEFKTLLQSCLSLKSLCLRERFKLKKIFDEGFFEVLRTRGQPTIYKPYISHRVIEEFLT